MATATTTGTEAPPLTPRQREILACFLAGVLRDGVPPRYRDVMAEFGFASTNSVTNLLHRLERKGYVALGGGNRSPRFLRWPDGSPFRGLARV